MSMDDFHTTSLHRSEGYGVTINKQHRKRKRKMHRWSCGTSWIVVAVIVAGVSIMSSHVTSAITSQSSTASRRDNADSGNADRNNSNNQQSLPPDFLVEDESVVLITGAAGFLGSELALALHRTYSPKLIILVDRMQDRPQSQEQLSLFEFQRQRAFHVLQTIGNRAVFYRADFAPMIPEYFDLGEVPVLDHIFREHPDITHVVHLADPYPHSSLQVVPHEKDVPKAGMMEALMEQLLVVKRRRQDEASEQKDGSIVSSLQSRPLPHFVYASSSDVYPYAFNVTNGPLEETQSISTPSSLRGASKLIDEMLAKMYYDTRGLYSVGLRFFSVYGPWGVPGSTLFEMAERAVAGDLVFPTDDDGTQPEWMSSVQDYVYIDDAIDAIMAAMQFRPPGDRPHPIIFNVASGEGNTPSKIASIMQEFFPPTSKDGPAVDRSTKQTPSNSGIAPGNDIPKPSRRTVSIGSIKRSQTYLRYQPRVSLRDGIMNLLAWHYDRAFPYGGQQEDENDHHHNDDAKRTLISTRGIESCLSYDKECLRAVPVFPCASECGHEIQCTKSYFDEIIPLTQSLTSECETVLYTVDLDPELTSIPSAYLQLQSTSKSFLKGNCNLAFVSDDSTLVKSLQKSSRMSSFVGGGKDKTILRNGAWILIAMSVPIFDDDFAAENDILRFLPKLSPGFFFGSTTKRAIYVEPNILLDSIPKLLHEAQTQPYNKNMDGATAMLIGRGMPKTFFSNDGSDGDDEDEFEAEQILPSTNTLVQNSAYRMVRIAVADKLFGDGFMELLDSRWMVHTLQSDDARLFRCDVYGEVVQWEVSSDRSALEFVLGLHDMWSRVIAKSSGMDPWWIGDQVVTVPERHSIRRRLLEETKTIDTIKIDAEDIVPDEHPKFEGESSSQADDSDAAVKEETGDNAAEVVSKAAPDVDDTTDKKETDQEDEPQEKDTDENEEDEEEDEEDDSAEAGGSSNDDDDVADSDDEDEESSGGTEQGALILDAGAQQEVAADEEKRGDSDDDEEGTERNRDADEGLGRDFSSYDTWMGILSSSRIKYFVRIVPSDEVGVVSIDR